MAEGGAMATTVEHRRDGQAGVRGYGDMGIWGRVALCFVSFVSFRLVRALLSCPVFLPSVLLIRLPGYTKSEQACKEGRTSLVFAAYLGIYQGTRNRVPKTPTLESSASARISAEGVGQPLT